MTRLYLSAVLVAFTVYWGTLLTLRGFGVDVTVEANAGIALLSGVAGASVAGWRWD
jgi:hypothetical protein